MSAFGIFALILTTAYIIYFTVVIVRDITVSRKSGNENPQAETFDTSFMDEQSVEVKETDGGFAVGENEIISTPIKVSDDSNNSQPETDSKPSDAETKAKLEESMPESVDVITEVAMDDMQYLDTLQGDKINAAGVYVERFPADKSSDSSAGDETPVDQF